uniref:Formin-like protein 13 n=1 Tax=Lepisosteus oculatus TaxID=7918 RepID=W5M3T9_LEPOC|nr:PREDICTED: formin-like protein 13 isoform X1 [Lepisosteus oculatus]
MALKGLFAGKGSLTAEKQRWLFSSVRTGRLTFGQAWDLMNEDVKTMEMPKLAIDVPQLSNEKQLSIMNMVKRGELTIEEALNEARKEKSEVLKQNRLSHEEDITQYNFSVYKYNRYRWQKRILQIDFKAKVICSIEKGIVKRQLPFSTVKSCDDGVGAKFSISFQGRHDYELEASSLEDKQNIMQLVNTIIYSNIYDFPIPPNSDTYEQPATSNTIREGPLDLQRGGLASVTWVRCMARLQEGELVLSPVGSCQDNDDINATSQSLPVVIHFSDGNASVEKHRGCDTFTVLTKKNEYLFRVPASNDVNSTEAIKMDRNEWVQAIDKFCLDWKRKSQSEDNSIYEVIRMPEIQENKEIEQDRKKNDEEEKVAEETKPAVLQLEGKRASGESDVAQASTPHPPSPPLFPPVPAVRKFTPALVSSFTPLPSPNAPMPIPGFAMNPPPPPPVPAPPPLHNRLNAKPTSKRTKAFHWDLVSQERIGKSVWTRSDSGKIKIDGERLFEQFSVQDVGVIGGVESNNNPQIMLNQKIAHNFNIFLKSFPVRPNEVKEKLSILNEEDGGLSDEQIASLRRYVPTPDDVEMYKSYKGLPSELHLVDQYMLEMCKIPFLNNRLDVLLTIRELPISMEDLQPLIDQKIKMCSQLLNCKSFVSVLEYLLAVGNYLNENAGKEKAKGYRLSSLTKLSQLRGKHRKFTLLHALVEQIMLHDPVVAPFFQELTEFEAVPGASIKGLTAEVDVLKNELQKIIQYKKAYKPKNQGNQHPKFCEDLKIVIRKYKADLSHLTKKCDEMKKLYSDILVKFGEPGDQDSQELFGWLCTFISDFKRIYMEMVP